MPPRRDPFEARLSDDERQALARELSRRLDDELSARATVIGEGGDLDYWHFLYEGGDRRLSKNTPWPGAANLTSYLVTEKVDALRARLVQTIFTEPIWIVEGWGESASRAPAVEAFHQWKAEEERLQAAVSRALHNALIEGTGVLEVAERSERRRIRRPMQVALEPSSQGGLVFDESGQPRLAGSEPTEPSDPLSPSALAIVDQMVRVRTGPQYRVLSLRDFLILPGHARDRSEVWGWAKRFYRRLPELRLREEQGIYRGVDELGEGDERALTARDLRLGQTLAPHEGPTAEKELWEINLLRDLDGDGIEEWYLVTLSRTKQHILRIQFDDLGLPRYILFTPFPRSDSLYGYSFVGHKISTIAEEHTAIRNAIADRSALVNSAPLKRVQGALWDPYEVPFGPRAVIDVRDPNEVQPMVIPDVPGSMIDRERTIIAAAERVTGLNDATLGVNPQADRTLGEFQMVLQQSFVRIGESIRYIQESMEDLWTLRHEIYKRALRDTDEGELAPKRVLVALEERGFTLPNGRFLVSLLEGTFRGKPRGSVETADLDRQRADFNAFMGILAQLAQTQPLLARHLQQPQVLRSILLQAARVYRWMDRQGLLGSLGQLEQPQPFGASTGVTTEGVDRLLTSLASVGPSLGETA